MPPKAQKNIKKVPKLPAPKGLRAKAVLSYLQANPLFLKTHAEALAKGGAAKAPKKVANIFSLHAARAGDAEGKLKALKKRHQQLIAIAKANAQATTQAHAAVLSILGATTPVALSKALQGPFRAALGLHSVRLLRVAEAESATTLNAAQLAKLCQEILTLGAYQAAVHGPLFGPQGNTLKSCALLRLTNFDDVGVGLLALGSEDAQHFYAGQGTDLLEFLRQVVSLQVAR
jgi:uncharacterized protein YigA (DUF484 family)